ncbi:MFS transporter [Nitrososphaera sp.]|uniref:MFS transporter n=1 Tax=Nitrososphaera sp. TaxID=1971748 RepID=UPI00307DD5CE
MAEREGGGSNSDSNSNSGDNKKNVYALGFVSFFTDLSSEMVFGLLPLFLTGQLGISRAALGMVEGMAEMLGYTVRMGSGAMSDRMQRRKPLVVMGYSLSAAAKPLFGAAAGWADAFLVRSVDRVGKGIRTAPRDALISESAPASRVGRYFGLHRSMDQAGAIAGPALAFALFPLAGFDGIFYLSLVPGAIAVVILLLFVKDLPIAKGQGKESRPSVLRNVRAVLAERRFVFLLAIMGVFSLGAFNFSFVLVRASDIGVADSQIMLVYLAINAAHTLVGYPVGVLADRVGREKLLPAAYGAFLASAFFMLLASGTDVAQAYLLAAVYGAYVGIAETVQRAVVPRYARSEHRATAYGLYNLVVGLAFLAANVVFGLLYDGMGLAAAVAYSATTSSIAIAAMVAFIATAAKKPATTAATPQ